MTTLVGGPPHALLEQPVFDAQGRPVGRVTAIGTRHGELCRIGVGSQGPEPAPVRFVARGRFRVERDRIVLAL